LKLVTLRNSKRRQPAGARAFKESNARKRIRVTIVVRSASSLKLRQEAIAQLATKLPHNRRYLSLEEFTALHGAREEDLSIIKHFAKKHGLRVIEISKARRCVVLSGTILKFSRAFQVRLRDFKHKGQTYRSHSDAIQIPSDLAEIVEGVLGLEDRSLMTHHAFVRAMLSTNHVEPSEVAKAYQFPVHANGKGERIAIIELGGGFYNQDIRNYFQKHKLRTPRIKVHEFDGQRNSPASKQSVEQVLSLLGVSKVREKAAMTERSELGRAMWTIESTIDIQLAGNFAHGAFIDVYFAPNNAQGKYHALTSALTNKECPPTILSCSWGAVEEELPLDVMHLLDQIFQDAALLGITVCFSSGDQGDDPARNGKPRAHFPATSPHVLSCGGTHWNLSGHRLNEVVWNETMPHGVVKSGGGVSHIFNTPQWQLSAKVKSKTGHQGRGTPDISGKADIQRGYCTLVAGFKITMGGTSSAAPMWAGLIARINQKLECRVGFLTPLLYQKQFTKICNDITRGNNGKFKACRGWDPCTGWGSPNGKKLLIALGRGAFKTHPAK
jgi:kumamolisin